MQNARKYISLGGSPLLNPLCCPRGVSQDASGTAPCHGPKKDHDDDEKLHPQPEFEHQPHHPAPLDRRVIDGTLHRIRIDDLDKGEVLFLFFLTWHCLNGCLGDGGLRIGYYITVSALGFKEAGQPSRCRSAAVETPVHPVMRPCTYGVGQAMPVIGLR